MQFRALLSLIAVCTSLFAAKRPLNHSDYDSWKTIHSPVISRDGSWVAYGLFPQDGDGYLIVRHLPSGREFRESAGAMPPPVPPNDGEPPDPEETQRRSVRIFFTPDLKFVVASTFPSKADVAKAKKDAKKPQELPKGGLVTVELATGASTRIDNVKSFQVPEKGEAMVAWLAGDLTLRRLSAGLERKFEKVTEFSLSKDGSNLVFATGEGVSVFPVTANREPVVIASGKGKYSKLTWDRAQGQMVFLKDTAKLFHWAGGTPAAREIVTTAGAGFPTGWVLSERGALSFSRDGKVVLLSDGPKAKPVRKTAASDETVSADLWHWKDPLIQPMQKIRSGIERTRSYRAAYHLADGKFVQLGDVTLAGVTPSDDGLWAIGSDARAYQAQVDYTGDEFADQYLVNTRTGERKLLLEHFPNNVILAPDARHALFWRDRQWRSISLPDGAVSDLTGGLGVAFHEEEEDRPIADPPYGTAGWTNDSQAALLFDAYDVWLVPADGRPPQNLTAGEGRKRKIRFRPLRMEPPDEDGPRGFDLSKPVTFTALDVTTRATGFWRGTPPQKLLMEDAALKFVAKAKESDAVLFTASTFREFPDLHLTSSSFSKTKRVTRANPQQDDLLWGNAELISYTSADGEPLRAVLIKPDHFDPAKRYPMIVQIYEKFSPLLHEFLNPMPGTSPNRSYYASNGYLFLMPDIHYAIGKPGQSALKCVLPAVQAVVARGFVDEKAIGLHGHSWGGYQGAYLVTQGDRFRAAITGAPVGNMTSAYNGIRWGTGRPRQFQYEHQQSRIGGTLWEYPMRYLENSPVFYADRVHTPVLILHDDEDDAVPWYQGIEWFLSLRRNGKEAYLFNYNGEKHGLRRRADQKDWTRRMQEYFDYFLKGAAKPAWMESGIPYLERDEEKLRYNGVAGAPEPSGDPR